MKKSIVYCYTYFFNGGCMHKTPSEYVHAELTQTVYTHALWVKYLLFSLIYSAFFLSNEIFLNKEVEVLAHIFSAVMAVIVADYFSNELLISIIKKARNSEKEDSYIFSKETYLYLTPVIFLSFLNIFFGIYLINPGFFNIPDTFHIGIFFALTIGLYILIRFSINAFISSLKK